MQVTTVRELVQRENLGAAACPADWTIVSMQKNFESMLAKRCEFAGKSGKVVANMMPTALLTDVLPPSGNVLKQSEEIGTGEYTGIDQIFGFSGKWSVKK